MVNFRELERRMKQVPWTAELRAGRVPNHISSRMGYWAAEEYEKFAFPVSPCILHDLLPKEDYQIWVLLCQMMEMVFHRGRLAQIHLIPTEELIGLWQCHVTLHNLIHLPADIERFGSPDNYWCFSFERAVKRYVNQKSNAKNIELSFAKTECRREFHKAIQRTTRAIDMLDREKMAVRNVKAAFAFTEHTSTLPPPATLLVGAPKPFGLSPSLTTQLTHDVENNGWLFRCGFNVSQRLIYRQKEDVIVMSSSDKVFAVVSRTHRVTYHFVEVTLYRESREARKAISTFCDFDAVEPTVPSDPAISTVLPFEAVMRKVMLYPMQLHGIGDFLVILDSHWKQSRLLTPSQVVVPLFPQCDDMLWISGEERSPGQPCVWLAKAISVDPHIQSARVEFYTPAESGFYKPEQVTTMRSRRESISWDSILYLARGSWIGNMFQPTVNVGRY